MILKRFKNDNIHYGYIRNNKPYNINESKSEKMSKLELLAHISKNWNDELTEKFTNIRSLYSCDDSELENIKNNYLNIDKSELDKSELDKSEINEHILIDTLAELTMKYGKNEAIDTIRIDEGKIVFDLLCDTDIEKSVTKYNGIELHYNKICFIPTNEKIEEKIEDKIEEDILDESILEQQSIEINSYFNKLF